MHELDAEPAGFQWVEANDGARSVLVYDRVARDSDDRVICALNFTPVPRHNYRIGVASAGTYDELLNTDAVELGGSGLGNFGQVETTPARSHGRPLSINATIPPLGAVFFKKRR